MTSIVHRGGLDGGPRCGAPSGRISCTGIQQFITCPACRALDRPISRAEALAALEAQYKALTDKQKEPHP